MRNNPPVQPCTPLSTNPDHNNSQGNPNYSPGNNPAGGKLIYQLEQGPLTDFLQVETEDYDLAAWFMVPEHKCRLLEIRLVEKNNVPRFRLLFTGFNIHTCQLAYYWHAAKKKAAPSIARGKQLLAGFIRRRMETAI